MTKKTTIPKITSDEIDALAELLNMHYETMIEDDERDQSIKKRVNSLLDKLNNVDWDKLSQA